MAQKETDADPVVDMRKRAYEALKEQPVDVDGLSPKEIQRVLYELRVHQLELEMQNEELRRTRQELEASRDRYSDLYDLAPVGYVTVDEEGLILEANLTSADLLGVERGRLIGRPLSRYVARQDQETFYLHRRRVFQSRAQQTCEINLAKADGMSFRAQMTSILTHARDGSPICRTALTDVSERARREAQLRLQAQLLENVRESVVATDLEGHVIYWGKGAEVLYGHRADEVMGKLVTFVVPPQEQHAEIERMRQVQKEGSWTGRYVQQRKDGTSFWADTVIALVNDPNGQPLGMIGIDRDITEQVRAETALAVSEEHWRSLTEYSPDHIMLLDQEINVLFINHTMPGMDREAVIGTPFYDYALPEYRETAQECFEWVLDKGTPRRFESTYRHEDGTLQHFESRVGPVRDARQRVVGLVVGSRDISRRVRTEEALRLERDRAQQYLDVAGAIIVALNSEGEITLINTMGCQILECDQADLVGKNWFDHYIPASARDAVQAGFRQLMAGEIKAVEYFENPILTARGTTKTIAWHNSLLTDDAGHPIGTLSSGTDITEQVRTEQEIERLARFPSENPNPVLRLRKDGTILYGNQSSAVLLAAWERQVGQRLPERWQQEVSRALDSGAPVTIETEAGDRTFMLTIAPLVEQGYVNAYGLDITEQVQTEQVIERLARFPSENPNPVLRVRKDGTILYGNQASVVLLAAWKRQVGQRLPDRWQQEVSSALDSGAPVTIETEAGDRTFMLTIAPLVEQGYVNAYGLDITRRTQAEEALRRALGTSQRRQREVSALLVASRAILNQRDFVDTARAIFDACKDLLGAAAGYVALLSPDGTENKVQFLDSGGLPCDVDPGLAMPIRGLRAEAYRSGQVVYDNHFARSEWTQYLPAGHVGLANVLFSPLVIEGEPAGLLGLANKAGGFTQDDARMAAAFGELVAIALHNSRTLASLANSEQRFRSVAETANDALISADRSGKIVLWNRAAQLMFGYSADKAVGKSVAMLMPERFRARHQQSMQRFVQTEQPTIIGQTIEMSGLRKDGSEFPLAISLATWKAGGNTFFTGVLRDITDRKQAEETLHRHADELEVRVTERTAELKETNVRLQQEIAERVQAEQDLLRLNQELETLNEVAVTLSLSSDLQRVLDATLDTVLATMEIDAGMIHLLDQDARGLLLVAHRGLAQSVVQAAQTVLPGDSLIQQAIQTGQPVTAARVVVPAFRADERAADATTHAFACVPLRAQDTALGVLCTYSYHPRELAPREVQLLSAIGHQVGVAVENARLTTEAAEMEVLQELDRLRSELIANVSHELRTPLGLIKAFCSSLMMEDVALPREAQSDFLQGIDEEADKLETIVANLLSISQMESGQLYLNRYPADVGQLIQAIVAMMGAQAPGHDLTYDLPLEPLVATMDARSIEQVMRNLLDNAIKYSPAGGTITVHGHRDEAQVLIAVSDQGIGIDSEDLDRIFERFYRVDNEVGRVAGGVGLGLAVCQSVIEAHGGRIWVESTPGKGSTFRFTLPAGVPDKVSGKPSSPQGENG